MASSSPTANPPQPASNDNMASNATSTIADTGFTDESLDRDWKPNGRRPQSYVSPHSSILRPSRTGLFKPPSPFKLLTMGLSSTIARSFSAELADIFRLDESVADLDAKIDERCVTPLPAP